MHELSITQSIVEIVIDYAGGKAVRRVQIEIGELSSIMPDALRFCFDVCSKDTVAEGAELEILRTEGQGRCLDCGREMPMAQLFALCSCGSRKVQCIKGQELRVKELEVV
ncbi:MAG: hydrogenase maturation nickel metallochaperone HypA [Candidatus Obscuribacterales bacterium]|nr:hydrogenase maturation nickel metallochaperone HypA [Candidatus Obscuribacterales bacterium]